MALNNQLGRTKVFEYSDAKPVRRTTLQYSVARYEIHFVSKAINSWVVSRSATTERVIAPFSDVNHFFILLFLLLVSSDKTHNPEAI